MFSELADGGQVAFLRPCGEPPQLHVLQHPSTSWRHHVSPFREWWEDRKGIVIRKHVGWEPNADASKDGSDLSAAGGFSGVLGMFRSLEVKALSQPDGGEG